MTFVCYIINKFFSWLFFFGCKPVQSFVNLWGRIFTDLNELFFLQLALVISPSRKIFESERDVALWCERKTPRTRTTCQRVRILAVWTQFVVSTKWACCSALCKLWQLSEIKNLPFLKLSVRTPLLLSYLFPFSKCVLQSTILFYFCCFDAISVRSFRACRICAAPFCEYLCIHTESWLQRGEKGGSVPQLRQAW